MAYNLYQVQMAKAWAERIEKETASAEKFWYQQAVKSESSPRSPKSMTFEAANPAYVDALEVRSQAGSLARSAAPSGATGKTTALRVRMEKLEAELQAERENRKKAEDDLVSLRNSLRR